MRNRPHVAWERIIAFLHKDYIVAETNRFDVQIATRGFVVGIGKLGIIQPVGQALEVPHNRFDVVAIVVVASVIR